MEYERQMSANGELGHAMEVVKWGTDYLIKAHSYSYVFYGWEMEILIISIGKSQRTCP